MTDFLETGFNLPPFLDGRYDLTPYLNQTRGREHPGAGAVHHRAQSCSATPRTSTARSGPPAAYAMAEIYAGPKLFLLPGVRYEYSTEDFVGRNVRFAPNGAWLGSDPLACDGQLRQWCCRRSTSAMPRRPTPTCAFAVTRTLARPNFYDAVPYRAQDDSAATVTLGNADLRPTKSWNVDVMAEHYFKSVGVVSAGVFYKQLTDYIYTYTPPQTINGVLYQVTQPLNGDAATVRGVEVALQNQLRFLPAPFNGLRRLRQLHLHRFDRGDSRAMTARTCRGSRGTSATSPRSYEKGGFTGRAALNFHGSYLDVVGASNALDRYYDTNSQFDCRSTQKVHAQPACLPRLLNLNDALLRYYQGVPDRLLQEEHYQLEDELRREGRVLMRAWRALAAARRRRVAAVVGVGAAR